jgi:hypothetical protein
MKRIVNEGVTNPDFIDFAKKRLEGCIKIAGIAKSAGGYSLLTYHHFVEKIPYYRNAAEGNFDPDATKARLQKAMAALQSLSQSERQIQFQKVSGLVEVLGELLMAHKSFSE